MCDIFQFVGQLIHQIFCVYSIEVLNFALRYEKGREYFIGQVKGRVMKQTQGVYPAPLRIIDVSVVLLYCLIFTFSYDILNKHLLQQWIALF